MAETGRGFGRVSGFDPHLPKRGAVCGGWIIRESAGLFPVFRASGESTTRTQPGWIPDGRSGTTLDDKCICIGRRRGWVVIQRNRIG